MPKVNEFIVRTTSGNVSNMPTCKHGRVEGFCQCWRRDALLGKLRADGATDLSDETIERIFEYVCLPVTCIRDTKNLRDCGDLTVEDLIK